MTMPPPGLAAGAAVGFAAAMAVVAAVGSGPWVGSGSRVAGWTAAGAVVGAAGAPVCPDEAGGAAGGPGAQAAATGRSRQVNRNRTIARDPRDTAPSGVADWLLSAYRVPVDASNDPERLSIDVSPHAAPKRPRLAIR